jgi:superfamily II DNA or RNA helicase
MKCKLIIVDEINVQFLGLSPECRRKIIQELEYFVPGAQYLPQVRLGRWNGKQSFMDLAGRTYLNLLDRVLPIVQNHGYEIDIDDQRKPSINFEFEEVKEDSYAHVLWPVGHTRAGQPIMIREHQVEAINSYLQNITGVSILPTGSGKTAICTILSHKVEKYGRSIIIVPTRDLVTQTEEDYINMGLDVGVFYGARKEYLKTHTICTWQGLESLAKKSKKEDLDVDIDKFFENVVCVIVDEVHSAKGPSLKKMLSTYMANVPIRWGLTGTMPEEEFQQTAVISCIGPLFGKVFTKDLQDKGILAKLNINVWQLQEANAPLTQNYQAELKWLTTNKDRLTYLANKVIEISEKENTLVLVDRIETGKILQSLIPDSVFVSGEMKSKDRKDEYKGIQEIDGKVIIATYSVASTGINIVRIFNLFLLDSGKSFIKIIQSIGRSLRVAPDKGHAEIYDVCSNTKYSKKHLTKRKKIYDEVEYPYKVTKISY